MKFNIIALLALTLLAPLANANQDRQAKRLERMIEKLQLSESQVPQFVEIMKSHHEQRKTNRDANRDVKQQGFEGLKSDLGSVLSAEQMAIFDDISKKRRQRKMEKQSRNGDCDQSKSLET